MIGKLLDKWKQEWWEKRESVLLKEFSENEKFLKTELEEHLAKDRASFKRTSEENREMLTKLELESITLRAKKLELEELEKSIVNRKVILAEENNKLSESLRILEAKAHPNQVWTEAFKCGFDHAWDTMQPVIFQNLERTKKLIHDLAVEETLRNNPQWRTNGNNKKNH